MHILMAIMHWAGTAWTYYGIEKVTTYTEENTPWIQTAEGIAVVVVSCLLAFFLLCLFIVVLVRCYRKRKRSDLGELRAGEIST